MKILKIDEFINEAKEFKYDLGCVMLRFDIDDWKKDVLSLIDEDDIYNEPHFGLEEECHVTVFFGIIPEKSETKEVVEKIKECDIHIDKQYELKKISIFENEDFDVVKFDVTDCDELKELNKFIKDEFPSKQDHPDYKPHVTIGYVKKGKGKKYVQTLEEPVIATPSRLVYSYPIDDGKSKRTTNIITY